MKNSVKEWWCNKSSLKKQWWKDLKFLKQTNAINNENAQKTIVKISDEIKTPEETVMTNPRGRSKKQAFLKLVARKFPFLKYEKSFSKWVFFNFLNSESYFLNYKGRKLHFRRYKKVPLCRVSKYSFHKV